MSSTESAWRETLGKFQHLRILASAGTGKTFRLTNRYLGLLFAGEAPEKILATTFTRKAAGEILERVFCRLADAALDAGARRQLAQHLGYNDWLESVPRDLLTRLVTQLHRLQVCTMDSFFGRLAGTFAFDLGLPPRWNIADDASDNQMRQEAIRQVLASNPRELVSLMRLLSKGETTRSVGEQVRRLVGDLHGLYRETLEEHWHQLPKPPEASAEEVATLVEEIATFRLPRGKMAEARDTDVGNANAENWEEFLSKGIGAVVRAGETTYRREPVPPGLREVYILLVHHARAVLVTRLARQTEATHDLLTRFDRAYQAQKVARRLLRFEDVTYLLATVGANQQLQEMYLQLDASVGHLLLDEFQDTSLWQWAVLQPLAAEIVATAETRSFFCVGDVKQAIYGWRGGQAALLQELQEMLQGVHGEMLSLSRRSSPAVVETVNRVFSDLCHHEVLLKYRVAATHWSEGFETHSTARTDLAGYVCLETAPDPARPDNDGEEAADTLNRGTDVRSATVDDATLAWAVSRIVALARAAPGRSLGVLVRKNATVSTLIDALRRQGVAASEEGGNPIDHAPPVALLLSLLTVADHPGDTAARYHVARSPLGPLVGIEDFADDSQTRRAGRRIRRQLLDDGYGATVHGWARLLAPRADTRDQERLLQLVALAYRFEAHASLRPSDFVDFVRAERVEEAARASVRVMTVHQCKGLEFDIVVLPELDERLLGQAPPVLTWRPHPVAFPRLACRYPNDLLRQLLVDEVPRVQEGYEQYRDDEVREALCLLYVALTRAVHALYMVIAPARENERTIPATFAGLLRVALANFQFATPNTVLYEHGDADWVARLPPLPTAPAAPPPLPPPSLAPSHYRGRPLQHQPISTIVGSGRFEVSERLTLGRLQAQRRNDDILTALRALDWLEPGGLVGAEWSERLLALGFTRGRIRALRHELEELLTAPLARSVFDYATTLAMGGDTLPYERRWLELWRDRPFAHRHHRQIITGRLDRMVLHEADGARLGAIVYDFRTDALGPDAEVAARRAAFYQPQRELLYDVVENITGLPRAAILVRHYFIYAGLVV